MEERLFNFRSTERSTCAYTISLLLCIAMSRANSSPSFPIITGCCVPKVNNESFVLPPGTEIASLSNVFDISGNESLVCECISLISSVNDSESDGATVDGVTVPLSSYNSD